jgi:DNA-directed RNA polymerase subunit RPC12/RpoP
MIDKDTCSWCGADFPEAELIELHSGELVCRDCAQTEVNECNECGWSFWEQDLELNSKEELVCWRCFEI